MTEIFDPFTGAISEPKTTANTLRDRLDKATPEQWDVAAASALDKQVGGSHYNEMAIQPIEFVVKNGLGFCEGNAIKYICRHAAKGGLEDLDKAVHYIELLKELKYGKAT